MNLIKIKSIFLYSSLTVSSATLQRTNKSLFPEWFAQLVSQNNCSAFEYDFKSLCQSWKASAFRRFGLLK